MNQRGQVRHFAYILSLILPIFFLYPMVIDVLISQPQGLRMDPNSQIIINEAGSFKKRSNNPELSVPEGLIATGGKGLVELVWDEYTAEDIRGYHLYRSQTRGGPYQLIASEPYGIKRYMDMEVQQDEDYYYVITVEDIEGNESQYSREAWATPTGMIPGKLRSLEELKGLSARINQERIILTWEESMDELVAGYQVYRRIEDEDTEFVRITRKGPIKWPIYEDRNIVKDQTYIYSVVTVDRLGNESWHPKQLRVTHKSLFISRVFFAHADKPLRGGQEMKVTLIGSSNVKAYFGIDGLATHITMEEVNCKGTYIGKYRIPLEIESAQASVICFLKDKKGKIIFMVAPVPLKIDNLPPPSPEVLEAIWDPLDGGISLKWALPDIGYNDVATYRIYRGIDEPDKRIASDLPKDRHMYKDHTVIPGTRYCYMVTSVDEAGNESGPSQTNEALIPSDTVPPYILQIQIMNTMGVWRQGETISVQMIGEPGCEAIFSIGNKIKDIPMIQIHAEGKYEGRYVFKEADVGKEMVLRGRLTDPSGNSATRESQFRITVVGK